MKNKRLAICLSIFTSLVVLIILSSAIFALSKVELVFLSNTDELTGLNNQIVTDANFKKGQNVLFLNKNSYISKIEKNNPYIKIINIETIFPNRLVINAVERQETFAVKLSNNSYAIIDEEFKVLYIANNFVNSSTNAISLSNLKSLNSSTSAGDILQFDSQQKTLLTQTFISFREWKDSHDILKDKIASVELDYERENQISVLMRSGVQIVIKDANQFNSDKFNLAFSAYEFDVKYQSSGVLEVRLVNENELRVYYLGKLINMQKYE